MKRATLLVALAAITTPISAHAQSDTAQALINILRSAADKAQSRKATARLPTEPAAPELSRPLQFSSGAGPVDPLNRNDPSNLDVAGVRLGMTPSEVAGVLRGSGYTDTGTESDQPSYGFDVRVEWSKQNDTPYPQLVSVPKDRYWQKGKQRVNVTFLALPNGPVANEITYTTEDPNLTSEAFAAQVRAKYGAPLNDDASDLRWCTVKAPECEDPRSAEYPVLAAWTGNRSIFLIGNDPGRAEAFEARRASDIASRKPPEPQAAF